MVSPNIALAKGRLIVEHMNIVLKYVYKMNGICLELCFAGVYVIEGAVETGT